MRRIRRIAVTACAASLLFGTLGTLNIPVGSTGGSILLARNDREQQSYNRGYEQGRKDARDGRGRESSNRRDSDFRKGYEDGYSQGLRGNRDDRGRPNDPNYDSRNDRYGRDGHGRDGYGRGDNSDYRGPGKMTWRGRVDDYVELRVQGNRVRSIERGGAPTYDEHASFSNPLPRDDVRVSVRKRDGRGKVSVLEQPNRGNNYTAVIKIDDNKGGADNYEIEMEWR